jgi:hypothetical protein
MDRVLAYSLIVRKLEAYRSIEYSELAGWIGAPPVEELIGAAGEPMVIAARVLRSRNDPDGIVVEVSVYGQNGMWDDQMSDRIIVRPPTGDKSIVLPNDSTKLTLPS